MRAVKDLGLGENDLVVVILPDSIRSYLSKVRYLVSIFFKSLLYWKARNLVIQANTSQFVDDDWLAANDLLPPTPPLTPEQEQEPESRPRSHSLRSSTSPFKGYTIASLRLKPVTTIPTDSPVTEAIETMREKGFDQLPVSSYTSSGGKAKLVGLVTLGNLLSYLASGRASPDSKVESVMFDFRHLNEVVTDFGKLSLPSQDESEESGSGKKKAYKGKRREFVQITKDTKLEDLNRFFEWNSAAIVTERVGEGEGELRATGVVTKVDLLTWLVRQGKS